jgi:hypothetical protein
MLSQIEEFVNWVRRSNHGFYIVGMVSIRMTAIKNIARHPTRPTSLLVE